METKRKMSVLIVWLLVVLIERQVQSSATSSIVFRNGMYDGIVVAISPSVPESSKEQLINSIQDAFTDANTRLYDATKRKATFGLVTILVPDSWARNGLRYPPATHQTWKDADVRIGDPNPQYGDQPYTLQPGLCGQPASFIHFTPNFLLDTNETEHRYGPKGKVLLHEWTHYRYGVFDEYGYPGDAQYPAAYSNGKQLLPTACANTHLHGHISDGCSVHGVHDPRCTFNPKIDQTGVNSSLMSMHFLPEVTEFCDQNTHDKFAPTKHNALCNRRSVSEVINSHTDFNKTWSNTAPFRRPLFEIVQRTASRYVLLLDCSSNMNDFVNNNSSTMQRITFVRSAAIRFIEDNLIKGTFLGLVSFGSIPRVLKNLTQLDDANRNGFNNAIPLVTCGGPRRNVIDAIKMAVELLNTPSINRTDGTIITVTNGITDDSKSYGELKTTLSSKNIRAVNIIYPPMPEVTALPSLADATAGRNYMIAEIGAGKKGNSSTFAQLLAAFDDTVVSQSGNPTLDRITVYERVHPIIEGSIRGNFIVDSSLGKNMTVVVSYLNRINIFNITLTSPQRTFGSDDFQDEMKKNTIVFKIKAEDAKSGVWEYDIGINKHDDQPITVTVSAQPHSGQSITVNAWTNIGNKALDASKGPVVIHAELFKGSRPVVNAKVWAVIERPKINNTFSFTEIELFDNGNGAPDATKNDGVYSRYFTDFVDQFGLYSVILYANDNDGRSRVVGNDQRYVWSSSSGVRPKDSNAPYCCGSEAPQTLAESTGPFQRSSTAPAFLVTSVPLPNVDVYPPSTVHDLIVENIEPVSGTVTLTWTAPGKDLDFGTVSSYELFYYHDYNGLINNVDLADVITSIIPMKAGSKQTYSFNLNDARTRYYFIAMKSLDGTQKSELSNVVSFFMPPKPTIIPPPTVPTDSTGSMVLPTQASAPRALLTAELIGIIVGCTLAFLLAVAIIVVLICVSRRRRKLQEKKMTHHTVSQVHGPDVVRPPSVALLPSNGKESLNSYLSGNSSPTPTKMEEQIKIENANNGGVYYTQTSSLINPRQFVPASEFLQHHEKQKHNLYAKNHINNYYYEDETRSPYSGHYAPMDGVIDRTSISSKPSSYGSQQTAEVTSNSGYGHVINQRDVTGYVNSSYEDGSENSAETARLRPENSSNYAPVVGAPRRVLSESQV